MKATQNKAVKISEAVSFFCHKNEEEYFENWIQSDLAGVLEPSLVPNFLQSAKTVDDKILLTASLFGYSGTDECKRIWLEEDSKLMTETIDSCYKSFIVRNFSFEEVYSTLTDHLPEQVLNTIHNSMKEDISDTSFYKIRLILGSLFNKGFDYVKTLREAYPDRFSNMDSQINMNSYCCEIEEDWYRFYILHSKYYPIFKIVA